MVGRQDRYVIGNRNILTDPDSAAVVYPAIGIDNRVPSNLQAACAIECASQKYIASFADFKLHYVPVKPQTDRMAGEKADPTVAYIEPEL
jgi:hypothetical protein